MNKPIPDSIAGVELHVLTRKPAGRTGNLLKTLVTRGVRGVDDKNLSMIDKFRLLASAYFTVQDAVNGASIIPVEEPEEPELDNEQEPAA